MCKAMNIKARGIKHLYLGSCAPTINRDTVDTLNKSKRTPQLLPTQKQRSRIQLPKPLHWALFEQPSGIQDAPRRAADVLGFTENSGTKDLAVHAKASPMAPDSSAQATVIRHDS